MIYPKNNATTYKTIAIAISSAFLLLAGCTSHNTQETESAQAPPPPAVNKPIMQADIARAEAERRSLSEKRRMATTQHQKQRVQAMVMHMPMAEASALVIPPPITNNDNYHHLDENGVMSVSRQPVSTFSIDVDTASYGNVRSMLNDGVLPPTDAVRTEEFINYFNYDYSMGESTGSPFGMTTDLVESPWHKDRHLLKIGIKGAVPQQQPIGSNLVMLIDVSGSMRSENKLPLLKKALGLLANQLSDTDTVSIVVYAGASGVVLSPTNGRNKADIHAALDKLSAGGSTNGGAGIELAYSLAEQSFIKEGINRVILATDGDFNVGTVDHNQLIDLIERKRKTGISLSVLGFGRGNYNDHLTEQLANKGNGNASYIDNLNEARKVLVDQRRANFETIAKDVKIQVEFNPATVAEYRLIGYENRALANEDFNNDRVDAGEIGAGHSVTAVYELVLTGSSSTYNDPLRYEAQNQSDTKQDELAWVKLRYKQPDQKESQMVSLTVSSKALVSFKDATDDFRFMTSVVGFAQTLRHSKFAEGIDYSWILKTANASKGDDLYGYRSEFIQLVRMASVLTDPKRYSQDEQNKDIARINE